MRIPRVCLIYILFLTLSSCSKPVELDLPLYDDKPVVNCLFTPEEPFVVHVSKTASQFDTMLVNVSNALVEIYQGEKILAELPSNGFGFYSDSTLYPEIGKSYTLKVNVPGYDVVTAIDSVPSTYSEFIYQGFEEDAWYNEEGRAYNALTFEIEDQAVSNFFEVLYRANYSTQYSWQDTISYHFWMSHFTLFDPVIEKGRTISIFTDQMFNGSNYTIKMMDGNGIWSADSLHLNVQVLQGSQTFYTYRTTFYKHDYAQYSDFFEPTEPVIMYSNINNGYGIFAGYRSKFYPLIFSN
ncbi:MAG: DUF4249 domain-containing protein [Prolixibacteraceae bacterium]